MKHYLIKNILKKVLLVVAIVLVAGILVLISFYFGYFYGSNSSKNIVITGISNMESEDNNDADFGVFWQAWELLKNNHIRGEELKNQDLVYGAIEGILKTTDDPHTVFLKKEDTKKFEEDIKGEFGGIGAELTVKDNYIIVVAPLENTPASRAGIKSGDKILEINHEPIVKADVIEVVKKIRGEVGKEVILTISSDGVGSSREVSLTREVISIPTLKWEIKDNDIAYVQLYSFNEKAPYLFYKTAMGILIGDTKGMVLDLRNNPGGYLEVAVNIAGWFFEQDTTIVGEKFKDGQEIKFTSSGTGLFKDLPIVVLVNSGSASASEILAGAMRDNRNIKLIGTKTFGKGTVQELENLIDGSKIKMTIAQWVMPNGHIIEGNGLEPDIEVEFTKEDAENGEDPQLERALEEIRIEIGD
ncbi:S41 family peptidase [Patescibacteria group bacterium]|nr:S41 family peptidase [Patescibacteria group bacterium]